MALLLTMGSKMIQGSSLFEDYRIANWDADNPATVIYVGFLTRGGDWYIVRYQFALKLADYIRGSGDYAAQWIARAALAYTPYDEAF